MAGAKKAAIKGSRRKLGRNDCKSRIKSCRKAGPYTGHAHRYDTDSEYRHQCLINGIPRVLVVNMYDATGEDIGEDEVLEKEYLDEHLEYVM